MAAPVIRKSGSYLAVRASSQVRQSLTSRVLHIHGNTACFCSLAWLRFKDAQAGAKAPEVWTASASCQIRSKLGRGSSQARDQRRSTCLAYFFSIRGLEEAGQLKRERRAKSLLLLPTLYRSSLAFLFTARVGFSLACCIVIKLTKRQTEGTKQKAESREHSFGLSFFEDHELIYQRWYIFQCGSEVGRIGRI